MFSDVEKIGEGGNGTVFRAKRKVNAELICGWDKHKNEWHRLKKKEYYYNDSGYVALKSLLLVHFLDSLKQDGQYLLVLWYYTKGDLRKYIYNSFFEMTLNTNIITLTKYC